MWWRLAGLFVCETHKLPSKNPMWAEKGQQDTDSQDTQSASRVSKTELQRARRYKWSLAGWFGGAARVRLGVFRAAWVVAAPPSPLAAVALPAAAARQLAWHAAAACGHWTCHPTAGGRESCGASGWGCTSAAGKGGGTLGREGGKRARRAAAAGSSGPLAAWGCHWGSPHLEGSTAQLDPVRQSIQRPAQSQSAATAAVTAQLRRRAM